MRIKAKPKKKEAVEVLPGISLEAVEKALKRAPAGNALLNVPDFIQIKHSAVGGLGAFSTYFLPKGIILGEYRGRIVGPNQCDGPYVLDSGAGFCWDASDVNESSWTRYINASQWKGQVQTKPNVRFVRYISRFNVFQVVVQTIEDIPYNTELRIDYGPDYGYE